MTDKRDTANQQEFRILVVIPTLGKRLETLDRTLSSIQNQKEVLVDSIIVAKTKTAELSAIAERYQASIITHPGNISAAINAGFAQATDAHKYVAWIGDDDMFRPDGLNKTSYLLEHYPEAVVAYGSCDYIELNGNLLFNRRPPPFAPTLLQFIPGLIKQETCLFRLSSLQRAGNLDEELKYTMDLDLLLKMRRLGSFIQADQAIAAFCWHPGSLTIANRKASLFEAQNVQRINATGVSRVLQTLLKHPIRYLVLALNWKINHRLTQPLTQETSNVRN